MKHLILTLLVCLLGVGGVLQASTLRDAGAKHDLLIGTPLDFWRRYWPDSEHKAKAIQRYHKIAAIDFNLISMSPSRTLTQIDGRGTYDWKENDDEVAFAEQHGMKLYYQSLVELPPWINEIPKIKLQADMTEWIRAVMLRYRHKVDYWIVVNEKLSQPGFLYNRMGKDSLDYARIAFRLARRLDPSATLIYNDNSIEYKDGGFRTNRQNNLFHILKQLKSEGVPIDAIGFQCHFTTDTGEDALAGFDTSVRRFRSIGLKPIITELDVGIRKDGDATRELRLQRQVYEAFTRKALEYRMPFITYWGFTDWHTWYSSKPKDHPYKAPAMRYKSFRAKPARAGILGVLR